MIKSFADRETEHICKQEFSRRLPNTIQKVALRLAKFFGVSDGYFMALRYDIDIRNAKLELAPQLEKIKTYLERCLGGKK